MEPSAYIQAMKVSEYSNIVRQKDPKAADNMLDGALKIQVGSAALVMDVMLTKGYVSRFVFLTQVGSLFEHNKAQTPEGRELQKKRVNENLKGVLLTYRIDKLVGAIGSAVVNKNRIFTMSQSDYDDLTFDPDKGKNTEGAYQELLVTLSLEKRVGKVIGRSLPGTGGDLVTTSGSVDVKGAEVFIDGLNDTRAFNKLVGRLRSNKDVKYLLDFRKVKMNPGYFEDNVLKKYFDAGVDKNQIILSDFNQVNRTFITIQK